MERQRHRRDRLRVLLALELQARAAGVEQREPRPRTREPGPRFARCTSERRTIVADAQHDVAIAQLARDLDPPGHGAARDAVLERVLDERRELELRHERIQRALAELPRDLDAIGEPRLLDRDVAGHPRELLAERDLTVGRTAERVAQYAPERYQHADGASGLALADDRRDGVQRVEHEMRMDLRA